MWCRASECACAALWHVASTAAGKDQLRPFLGEIAPAAMSVHAQSNNLAQLLTRMS